MKDYTLNIERTIDNKSDLFQEFQEYLVGNRPLYLQRITSVIVVFCTLFYKSKRLKVAPFINNEEVLQLNSGNEVLDRFYRDGIKLFVQRNDLPNTLEG